MFNPTRLKSTWHTSHVISMTSQLRGVSLLGSGSNSYTVTLEVKDTSNNKTLVSKTGTYSLKLLQCKDYSYHGFDLLFDCAIVLQRNTRYRIEAIIVGPTSVIGKNSSSSEWSSGVTLTFLAVNCLNSNNRDNSKRGQFPELLFSV